MLLPLGEGAKTVNRFSIHKTALAIQGRKPDAVKCRYRCCANGSPCSRFPDSTRGNISRIGIYRERFGVGKWQNGFFFCVF